MRERDKRQINPRMIQVNRFVHHVFLSACLCTVLAGCGNHGFMVSAISVPAKFDAYTCKQLTGLTAANAANIKLIEGAMNKASTETVGPAINFAVHSSRLAQLRADTAYLAESFADKKCEVEAAPALPATPPPKSTR